MLLAAVLIAFVCRARASDFSTTNVQLLYGGNFHDACRVGRLCAQGQLQPPDLAGHDRLESALRRFTRDFAGYVDVNGKPQLLWDLAPLLGMVKGGPRLGLEWYFHHHRNIHSSVPQAMVQWAF